MSAYRRKSRRNSAAKVEVQAPINPIKPTTSANSTLPTEIMEQIFDYYLRKPGLKSLIVASKTT